MAIRLNGAYPNRNTSGLDSRSISDNVGTVWTRPSDWLALPVVNASDQKFVGLHAVYAEGNFVALSAAGDYTVDWGDGTVENFSANAVAQHEYNYNTFDTGNTTLTTRGYKQAIVVVTPQAGQNLTFLNLHQRHSNVSVVYSSGFLDIVLSGEYLTDLRIGVTAPGGNTQNIRFADLEQVNIVQSDLRTLERLFYGCYSLQSIINIAASNKPASTLSVTFTDAGDLVTATNHGLRNGDTVYVLSTVSTTGLNTEPYYVISATTDTFQLSTTFNGTAAILTTDGSGTLATGISMLAMFIQCYNLIRVPLLEMKNVICINSIFNGCSRLIDIPFFDTSSVVDMSFAFSGCRSLKTIPKINTSSVLYMASLFSNCTTFTKAPFLDTSNVKNMNGMFSGCSSLVDVPLFDTSSVTIMTSMFFQCQSLMSVPLFDTSSVTIMNTMFFTCPNLKKVPSFNTSSVTSMSDMFNSCYSLASVPAFNTSAVSSSSGFTRMFNFCSSLTRIEAKEFKYSFSVANCKLSATALNEIYTNLPTVTGQTITVTGNYGTASDDPTIATAKGWTVTG